jgi:hypothetical protein
MRRVIWLQAYTVFWLVEESFLSAVEGFNDVRQTEIQTGEPHVPEPNTFEFKMATEKLKRHKSPGVDEILPELIKAGERTVCTQVHRLINSIWNKEKFA